MVPIQLDPCLLYDHDVKILHVQMCLPGRLIGWSASKRIEWQEYLINHSDVMTFAPVISILIGVGPYGQ